MEEPTDTLTGLSPVVSLTSSASSYQALPAMSNDVFRNSSIVDHVVSLYRGLSGKLDPRAECLRLINDRGPSDVDELLSELPPAWSDYAIACVYAVLMPRACRKQLGIYFTPPHLVSHLLQRMRPLGLNPIRHRLRDPSAGGAAFLVPLAREMVRSWKRSGVCSTKIVARLRERLLGREIDAGLASIANALMRRMLVNEFGIGRELVRNLSLVRVGDSLTSSAVSSYDHELSNPPYLRLDAEGQRRWRTQFSDILSGRLNLYAMFVRRALNDIPPGGLVGHVLPASFLGGPEFSAFRRRVLQLAEVRVLDVVEKRKDVFLDATQDACFVVFRRRTAPLGSPPDSTSSSGVLHHLGGFAFRGEAMLPANGSSWSLPGSVPSELTTRLIDHGYRGMVGYLVANRQSDRLCQQPGEGRLPLVWAKCINPEGIFDFDRGRNAKKADGYGFVTVPNDAPYVVRVPCVLVQRTSSSSQSRRLVAAAVPEEFLQLHGGFVGENHVIILVPTRADAIAPEKIAAVLNGPEANAALTRVCGAASISVRVLECLPLPLENHARD